MEVAASLSVLALIVVVTSLGLRPDPNYASPLTTAQTRTTLDVSTRPSPPSWASTAQGSSTLTDGSWGISIQEIAKVRDDLGKGVF